MKQLLAYVFLFIFSFQVLPVKELGKLLSTGQMTEEIQEAGTNGDISPETKAKKGHEQFKPGENGLNFQARINCLTGKILAAIQIAENLPLQFIPDIVTPPPNFS